MKTTYAELPDVMTRIRKFFLGQIKIVTGLPPTPLVIRVPSHSHKNEDGIRHDSSATNVRLSVFGPDAFYPFCEAFFLSPPSFPSSLSLSLALSLSLSLSLSLYLPLSICLSLLCFKNPEER